MSEDRLSHRRASCVLELTDRSGNPLGMKSFRIEQVRHEFLFGAGAFGFLPPAGKTDAEDSAPERSYAEKWLSLFNYGTLPFYWGRYEPVEGEPQRESLMKAARLLRSEGAAVKGHPLCWHTVCADWLMKYDNSTILKKQLDRITREVGEFRGVIDYWDVINEVVIMPVFDRYDNAVTRICRELGRTGIVREVFAAAKAANPDAVLLINDFNTSPAYEELIDSCLEAGVPIGAIGIQSHQHQGYWGAEKVQDVLDRFSRFGLPVHFTENTLISGHLMPPEIVDLNDYQIPVWPTTPEGEARQAEEIEEMYRILFEHPLVQAITGWDFRDGGWLGAPAGLLRADNTEKPAYRKLKEMIQWEWRTAETVRTDENGCVSVTGFKGLYSLSPVDDACAEGKMATGSFRLAADLPRQRVIL